MIKNFVTYSPGWVRVGGQFSCTRDWGRFRFIEWTNVWNLDFNVHCPLKNFPSGLAVGKSDTGILSVLYLCASWTINGIQLFMIWMKTDAIFFFIPCEEYCCVPRKASCPACAQLFPGCVVSARTLSGAGAGGAGTLWACATCGARAHHHDLVLRHSCPMCHVQLDWSTHHQLWPLEVEISPNFNTTINTYL